ncbi:aminotransferase class V-fold PLP-dependent enzyme [Streptomyces sp. V4-01]|uniref:Aminotransferase class V-fold PLP-dependent enzyme n=1 Tax=Actinacidiphila polyblastidii TaxID=3110430 RepID=A0ABU7P7Z2_9ACTN|nr:aminotransferase class V-fold PLP-dependent enzyme [Streptomyces sp. V4-01]
MDTGIDAHPIDGHEDTGALLAAAAAEYPGTAAGYLDTATLGLPPARTAAALRAAVDAWAAGRPDTAVYEEATAASRAAYARITGVPAARVALAGTVAGAVGLVAAALPPGAEVLVAEGDFSSVVQPFAGRGDLRLRTAPLDAVAAAVREDTALVAVSTAQSADGRVADLAAISAAARAYGARMLLDGTQSVGWLPVDPDACDYLVCHGYKWLLSPHGACFLTVREGLEPTLSPAFAGWYCADDPWESCYGPVERLAPGARRFDTRPAYLSYVGAAASLSLVEEIGVPAIHAHDVALAARLRDGLSALGHTPLPGASAIVAVPGMPADAADRLAAAGIRCSARAGNLRFALHLYNRASDVDAALAALA